MTTGQLMFEVGIKETDNQLTELEKRLKNIVTNYGKLELKVQVDGLKAFTAALENIGQSKGLDALQKRIDVLQVTLANVGMSGAKSIQEFEAAVKTTSAVAEQYTQRINQMTAARDKFANGSTQWMSLNNKLTDFQNDKQVIAIYAQEQVAIKNLEDAKARLSNTNAQEVESYQKVISSIETLSTAANTLKTALGSWDAGKGNIAQLVEQFEKLHKEISGIATSLKGIDPSKLNFSGLNINVGNIAGLGDLNSAIRGLEVSINDIIRLFSNLANAVKLQPLDEQVKALLERCERAETKLREVGEAARYLNERAGERTQQKSQNIAGIAGLNEENVERVSNLFERYRKLLADVQNQTANIGGIQNVAEKLGLNPTIVDQAAKRFEALWKTIENSMVGMEKYKGFPVLEKSSDQLAKIRADFNALRSEYKQVIQEANNFNRSTEKGSSQSEARIRKLGMAFNELKNYMKANGGSDEMKRLQTEIQGAIRKMRDLMNAGKYGEAINVYERLSGIIRQAASETKDFERAQHSVSGTVSHTNAQLMGQSQILSDLKSMAMQYLSVWGAQTFLNNIIELGGQLEQQRLSIGAILQDTAQANHLFGQIKDLAIKSPFGVQQLDQMTKQLSAYGFKYSELYDMTKRLADISAATGTGVDRLALALGHVRSEGALSGYTLRQFSMGNIPLLQKLSENLGKTTQEIRKMTRNKEIGYEEVLNVIKQLTDESGMFYNAQEVMSQALNAKFKNLRDSFQIMYSEMAEGAPGDFLKGVATVLTDISKSWRVLMPVVLSGAGALGIYKLATMALNHELERTGKTLGVNAIATSKYSASQLRAIATTGRWTLALRGLGNALMSIGKFLFNPITLGFAAIEGLIYLWSKHNDEVRKAKDLTKAYGEAAEESEKNISKQLEKIKPFSTNLDNSALKTGIDSMTESLKNYAVNGQSIINSMFDKDSEGRVMTMAEKYKYLRKELENTINVYKELKRVKDAFEYGINESDGGWLDDNVETDLTQYSEAYKKFVDDVTSYNAQYGNSIENAIKAAEKADPAFAKATQNLTSYGDKLAEFWSNPEKYKKAAKAMGNLFGSGAGSNDADRLNESFFGYLGNKKTAMDELDQFIDNTEERLKEKGYDFSKELAPEQVGALLKMSKDWLEKHPEWENIYSEIKEKLEGRWPIKIEPDTSAVDEGLPQWMQDIQNELDGTGITLTADMSMEQIFDAMKKGYDTAQTAIDKLGPLAFNVGLKLDNITAESIAKYGTVGSADYNPELYAGLSELLKNIGVNKTIDTAGKKRGWDFSKLKKNGTPKKEKENQEAAKAVREQVRVIKEAADAFQYWREKVGDKGAWEHVQSEFGDVLKKIGITANDITDVRKHLNDIPKTKAYKAITNEKVRTEVDKEIAKENDQYTRKDFEKKTEDFLSRTKMELDNLTRSWETFNSVREATGDINIAVRFSGAEYALGNAQNVADALKKQIERDFMSVGAVAIPFNAELSERDIKTQIEEQFKKYEPTKGKNESKEDYNKRLLEYQSHIKSVVDEYKKWADLQRKVQDNAVSAYMKMISDSESLKTKLAGVNNEYRKQIENLIVLKNLGMINQEEYNNGVGHAENSRNLGMLSLLTNEVDWGKTDEFFGRIFRDAAEELGKQLNKFIGSKEYNALDVTQQQQYLNIREQLFKGTNVGSNPLNPSTWQTLASKTREVQKAFKDLVNSTLEYNAALEAEENARKAAADAKGTPAEQMFNDKLRAATNNRVEAENQVTENQKKFKKSSQEQQQASESAAKGLQDFNNAISSITSGSLSDLTLGIGNLVRSFMKGKDAAGTVSELLAGIPDGYGQIIAAALQLLDMLKDKSAETIRELLTNLFDAATGIVKDLFNGKLIEAIVESAVEGVGKIVSEIIANIPNMIGGGIFSGKGIIVGGITGAIKGLGAGIGNAVEGLLGVDFNNSNEAEVRESIDRLNKENERLATVIEEATKELKESNGMRAINAAKEARDAQTQYNANIMNKWREGMGYHSAHHSNSYSWDLEDSTQNDVNAALRAYAEKTGKELKQINVDNWEEFMTLTPEEMDYIRKHAQGAWEDITTEGKYEWVHEYLNEYADQAGKLEEMSEELREKLTLQSVSGLHDQFVNELMDMEKTAKDFSKDFSKMLMKAVLNAQIADLLDDQLKQWRDTMATYMEEDGDNLSPAHIAELQKMWDDIVAQGLKIRDNVASAVGYTGENSSSGLSSNIKNISEQTADILASYVNAMRADVAVNRQMISQYFPMYYQAMTTGNESLRNIENHTSAIMQSNETIANRISALDDKVNGLKNGTWRMPVA